MLWRESDRARNRPELSRGRATLTRGQDSQECSQDVVEVVILALEVLAQHLSLVMVETNDHIVAALFHVDLVRHPTFQIQSEGSQDQRIQSSSNFSGHEARRHQVTQNLDWQFQTTWYPVVSKLPDARELL